jgi:xanthine dehydrogenase accessory factor
MSSIDVSTGGLDLGVGSPEETAFSILAEVIAVRHGRERGKLAHAGGRIHATAA